MPTKVNQPTFAKMLAENIEWLDKQRHSLERDHVVQVLQWLIDEKYMPERIAELEAALKGATKCQSCSEPLSRECPRCKRLWES